MIWFDFSVCYIVVFLSTCSGRQNTGCWTSPSLFICRNTLVRGASVCSSCVLNAKRGSILQSIIDCLLVFNWSCFCVWQYSVVLPGSILRCVKIGCLRRGCGCLSLQAAPPARRLSPLCPLPSCYAMTSFPPPPQPDPVAPPLTRHQQALLSVSMQKTRGWGPLQHIRPDLGVSTPPRALQTLILVPCALLSALQAAVSVKSG